MRRIVAIARLKLKRVVIVAAPHAKATPGQKASVMKIRAGLAGGSMAKADTYLVPKEYKGRKAERPIDLAWLEPKAREWAAARSRITTAKHCRCQGKCGCG